MKVILLPFSFVSMETMGFLAEVSSQLIYLDFLIIYPKLRKTLRET
jgi:hypothetical protein